jgi:hypothetical protein
MRSTSIDLLTAAPHLQLPTRLTSWNGCSMAELLRLLLDPFPTLANFASALSGYLATTGGIDAEATNLRKGSNNHSQRQVLSSRYLTRKFPLRCCSLKSTSYFPETRLSVGFPLSSQMRA